MNVNMAGVVASVNKRSSAAWSCGLCVAAVVTLSGGGPAMADDHDPPVIHHRPVSGALLGGGVTISVTIKDASRVAFPRVYYRQSGETRYQVTSLVHKGERFLAEIPAHAVSRNGVEYYLEAFDAHGNGPAHHGSARMPHRVKVSAATPTTRPVAATQPGKGGAEVPAATPWYKRWWVWTVAGVVVAGSVTAIVVAATYDDSITVHLQADPPQRPGVVK